jgi:hypothetical protein
MPTIILSDKRCIITKVEPIDEEGVVIKDLIVSLEKNTIKPVNPNLKKEYKFSLKAYVNGGNFTITTNKTLNMIETVLPEPDFWHIYYSENDKIENITCFNEIDAMWWYTSLHLINFSRILFN